jgi:hypothetical protein
MSDKGEDDLIALVASEQRGFRRILFAGLAALLLLVGMSAALGVYYWNAQQEVARTATGLQRQAFETRRDIDRQNNRIRVQENAIRRMSDELRTGGAPQAARPEAALEAARAFLQRGQRTLADERMLEAAAAQPGNGPAKSIISGAAVLMSWERNGDQIQAGAKGLPTRLAQAERDFQSAINDPQLGALAQNGVAWTRYLYSSSLRSNYAEADCAEVFKAIEASAAGGQPGPQPLYWRAQCERKLGRTREALRDYALALQRSGAAPANESELTLAMNAYHGVGTVLIALFDAPDDAEIAAAVALAARACGQGANPEASPRMRLALACLDKAIELRGRLRQTDNQISGSGENKGFAYLRDGNFEGAFYNADKVEETGLFAWNELVRALAASHLKSDVATEARAEALRNIGFFKVAEFNVCELRALLGPELFAEATRIIAGQHKGETVACS